MALSQLQCLDDNNVNLRTHDAKSDFFYCENQRLALEVLLRDGREAFRAFLKERELRGFLSDPELETLTAAAEPYDPGSDVLLGRSDDSGDADAEPLSLRYWPDLSDTSVPELDLGWPDCASYRGVTRTNVFTQPPLDGQVHIKEIVRKTIAQAQKVIAVVMDVFTDVDIFRDLLDAGHKRKVSVYILLERTALPHFLSMLDRHLVTVVTGQAVDSFDRLFRELYGTSSAVDLQRVAMEPEPEPQPLPQPVAVAPPSAEVVRKMYNPKYALLAMGTNSASPAFSSAPNTPKDSNSMKGKRKMAKKAAQVEAPPLHPGLVDLEKAYLIPYLPIWPEPDPSSDVIGFINVRDNSRQMQVHMQRSERFETSQAIRFSSPFSAPKETLPEVAQPRQHATNLQGITTPEKESPPCAPVAGSPTAMWRTPDARCSPNTRTPTPDTSDGYVLFEG
ncbi:hypothetical protein CRUP_014719 [Coryphaenoides rupestris]|nr:hypothetical protein CRUP_014719 [Coryphaenoides rupestris]